MNRSGVYSGVSSGDRRKSHHKYQHEGVRLAGGLSFFQWLPPHGLSVSAESCRRWLWLSWLELIGSDCLHPDGYRWGVTLSLSCEFRPKEKKNVFEVLHSHFSINAMLISFSCPAGAPLFCWLACCSCQQLGPHSHWICRTVPANHGLSLPWRHWSFEVTHNLPLLKKKKKNNIFSCHLKRECLDLLKWAYEELLSYLF